MNNQSLMETWKNDEITIKSFNDIPHEVVDEIDSTDYDVDWDYYLADDFGAIGNLTTFRLGCEISQGDYGEKKITSVIKTEIVMGETVSSYMVRGVVSGNSFCPVAIFTLDGVIRT